jgi:hypothetical protein
MRRSMVGLLAAAGAAMSALVGLFHGDLAWVMVSNAAAATGLAAYLAQSSEKKELESSTKKVIPGLGRHMRRSWRSRDDGSFLTAHI